MNNTIRQLNWIHLRSFLDVSEHGSLTAAARATGLSQPTISRHIAMLEQFLGVVLFERDATGAVLTPNGERLKERVTAMRDIAISITAENEQESAALRGVVRITASRLISTYALPALLKALRESEPELSIELAPSDTVENLSRRDADIAIRMVRPKDNALIGRKLGEINIHMFGAKSYLNDYGRPTDAHSLRRHRLIGYDRSTRLIDGFNRAGVSVDQSAFQFRSDDQILCWQMICAGYGLGFTAAFVGNSEASVERVALPGASGSDPVWLIAHQQLHSNPRVRRVFDFLSEHLPKRIFVD